MKNFIRAVLLIAMLLVMAKASKAQVSVGIMIGVPPPPRVAVVVPARPEPASVWVEGYWYPVGNHYKWHGGYWTRPPYEGAHWVAPTTTANVILRATGTETTAVLNTIITRITIETAITTIMIDTKLAIMTETTDR